MNLALRKFNDRRERPARQSLGLASTGLPLNRKPMGVLGQATQAEYVPPNYPDRPQFKAPQSLDLRKALKSGVEAGLTMTEFTGVLDQIGVVNKAEQDEALQSYERILADYQDQLGRVEIEEKGRKDFKAEVEEKRRYGLTLAKEARTEAREIDEFERGEKRKAFESERTHGLGLRKIEEAKGEGLKDREMKRKIAVQKGRIALAKGGRTGATRKGALTDKQYADIIDNMDESWLNTKTGYSSPEAEQIAKNAHDMEYQSRRIRGYKPQKGIPTKTFGVTNKKTGKPVKVNGKPVVVYVDGLGNKYSDAACTDLYVAQKGGKGGAKDTETKPKKKVTGHRGFLPQVEAAGRLAKKGARYLNRPVPIEELPEYSRKKLGATAQGEWTKEDQKEHDEWVKEDKAKKKEPKKSGKRKPTAKNLARRELLDAVRRGDIPESQKTPLYRAIDTALKKYTGL